MAATQNVSPLRIPKKMPSMNGVKAGQTANLSFPIGSKYHALWLTYSGVTLAQMTEIRILAGTKVIHRYSATERDTMNQFRGLQAANGILYIPFDRPGLLTRHGIEETAVNTGSQDPQTGQAILNFSIEIDIAAAATGPALSIEADISDSSPGGPGTVLHVMKTTRSATGSGDFEIGDLPFNQPTAMALNASFFWPSANDISNVLIERGLYKVFERSKTLNEFVQKNGERTPQAGLIAVDWTEQGFGGNLLDLMGYSDFRYRLTMTGAADLTIIQEYMGVLGS